MGQTDAIEERISMSTKTEVEILPEIDTNVTENDGKAHWVRIKALIAGGAVVALCGKKYIPVDIATAGEKKICPKCSQLMDLLKMME